MPIYIMNPNIVFSWRREGENKKRERNEDGGGERIYSFEKVTCPVELIMSSFSALHLSLIKS